MQTKAIYIPILGWILVSQISDVDLVQSWGPTAVVLWPVHALDNTDRAFWIRYTVLQPCVCVPLARLQSVPWWMMRFWLDGACIAGRFAVDERQISCSGKIEWRPGHHSPEYVCVRIIRRCQKHAGSVPVLSTLLSSTWDGQRTSWCLVGQLSARSGCPPGSSADTRPGASPRWFIPR